jgi:toxin FitB
VHLLDTNVISELMRARPIERVQRWAEGLDRCAFSVVTLEEVWFGLASKRSARLESWFEAFVRDHGDVLPVTASIARRCAGYRAQFRASGQVRTQADMLIAGTASEHDLVLVTRNERDFEGCGLRLLNPF